MGKIASYIIFLCVLTVTGYGQTVTVANEINIRNDYAYDILGQIENNILLFRDQGREQTIHIYDENLKFKRKKDLEFERKRVRIINVTPLDSVFNVVYTYRIKDTTFIKLRAFDKNVILVDTVTLERNTDKDIPRFYRYALSEDKSKSILFGEDNNEILHLKVVDNNRKEILWKSKIELGDLDLDDDFRKIVVSNEGLVVLMFEKDNARFSKDKHAVNLLGLLDGSLILKSTIELTEKLSSDLKLNYNNRNGHIVVSGLSHEKKSSASSEYFFVNKHISDYDKIEQPIFIDYGLEFISEVYGKKIGKEKELEDYLIREVILKADGGFILITEMDRDYSRRSSFASPTNSQSRNFYSNARGWTDHYNEDIVMFSVSPDGTEHWRKVLYKKQFSQDDGGVYSSFYVFKTPSRLKLLYNDEIKNNNTASEYIINPLGKYERNSLLSTDYQNLRLRFKDALQISNSSLLVPSEKNYNLRIVKIEYGL